MTAPQSIQQPLADDLLDQLSRALHQRNISEAKKLLRPWIEDGATLDPILRNSGRLLDYISRWVDFDRFALKITEKLYDRFEPISASSRNRLDGRHVDMAKGVIAFHHELYTEQAFRLFESVIKDADRRKLSELSADAAYFGARALWKSAQYTEARKLAQSAEAKYEKLGYPESAAVAQLLEAWLLFLEGEFDNAERLLQKLETVIKRGEDTMNYLNVLSFKGRLARVRGSYGDAAGLFKDCISVAKQERVAPNRTIPRVHANLAFVYRLQAVELEEKTTGTANNTKGVRRQQVLELRRYARHHLDQAERIYLRASSLGTQRGIGKTQTSRALLFFDDGDKDKAREQIQLALKTGSGKEVGAGSNVVSAKEADYVVLANANIVQCMIDYDESDESHHKDALKAAAQAVECAERTGNRRLKIRAYVWKARSCLTKTFRDQLGAKSCLERAKQLLKPEETDYLRRVVQETEMLLAEFKADNYAIMTLTPADVVGKKWDDIKEHVQHQVVRYMFQLNDGKVARVAKELGLGHDTVDEIVRDLKGN